LKRLKLGIPFDYDEGWMGGYYYLTNLIKALNRLPDSQKPEIHVIGENENVFLKVKEETNYEYLEYTFSKARFRLIFDILHKVKYRLAWVSVFLLPKHSFDVVFPYKKMASIRVPKKGRINWIPDFQEEYLPDLFSEREKQERRRDNLKRTAADYKLVLSSYDSLSRLQEKYPNYRSKPYVIRFAVTNEAKPVEKASFLAKYGIRDRFIYSPNQFWKHKNQKFLIETLLESKYLPEGFQLIFSGNEKDNRGEAHIDQIKTLVLENGLSEKVSFLGFIPKEDVISLMSFADAVVQPSLFEGWSTVVEDAKSQNACIVASEISVHKEQLENYPNALFFDPKDADSFVLAVKKLTEGKIERQPYCYGNDVEEYAKQVISCLKADDIGRS